MDAQILEMIEFGIKQDAFDIQQYKDMLQLVESIRSSEQVKIEDSISYILTSFGATSGIQQIIVHLASYDALLTTTEEIQVQ